MTDLTTARPLAPVHTVPDDLAVLDHLGFLCRVLVEGDSTGGAFSLLEERGRVGCMSPRHLHARESETFIVTEGALEAWCEGSTTLVEAGELIHLPAGREHAFRVASAEARFFLLVAPGGFEQFFRDTGTGVVIPFDAELPVPGAPSPEQAEALAAGAARHDCTVLGPPPFAPPG
jgi:quercetin dioxygenase-like cupin family protein